jgi:hypothetical protein
VNTEKSSSIAGTANALETARSHDFRRYLSPASFWKPQYLESSAWIEHSPFAFWITGVLKPRSIVELGTHSAFSYFAFCQAVQTAGLETRCFAIDTWRSDGHAGLYAEAGFESVDSYNNQHYSTFSRLVRSTCEEALPYFSDSSVDFLHIDGRPSYKDVRDGFESWRTKLSERAVVLFHDTNVREHGSGVFQFWAELASKFPHFEFFHGHGLGVLGYGADLPEEILSLCKSSAYQNSAVAIRTAYSHLGGAVQSDCDANIARSRVENLAAIVGGLRMDLDDRNDEITKLGNEWKVLNDEYAKQRWELERANSGAAKLGNEWKVLNDANALLKRELENHKSENVTLRTQLEARDDETTVLIRDSDARYSKLAGEFASVKSLSELLEAGLAAHQQQLLDLEGRIAARARELCTENLTAIRKTIAELENANADLKSGKEDARARIAGLEVELLQLQAERTVLLEKNRSLELQLSAQSQALAEAMHQVQALYASSSWKLTRPLRVLKRGAMRLRRTESRAIEGAALPTSAIKTSAEPQKTLPAEMERSVGLFDKVQGEPPSNA